MSLRVPCCFTGSGSLRFLGQTTSPDLLGVDLLSIPERPRSRAPGDILSGWILIDRDKPEAPSSGLHNGRLFQFTIDRPFALIPHGNRNCHDRSDFLRSQASKGALACPSKPYQDLSQGLGGPFTSDLGDYAPHPSLDSIPSTRGSKRWLG